MSEYPTYLIHYGTLGQKWGVRKYQNEDGTWTEEGLRRRRKDNYNYLKKVKGNWKKSEDRAKELTKNFSEDYKKGFDNIVKNTKSQKDMANIGSLGRKKLDEINIDKEVENTIGKYANKMYDSKMSEKYGDLLKRMEINRLYYEAGKNYQEELNKRSPKIVKKLEEADMLTEDRYWDNHFKNKSMSDDEIFDKDERLNAAAITGLKALDGKDADISTSNKWWFICEDQTIGYATVADLANRGKTKSQIKSLINDSKDIYYDSYAGETREDLGYKTPKGVFQLAEGYISDDYIDECIKIAKENTLSDAKQSRIKSLISSGKSQEEVAKMLGVSTSTVNKYK